MIGLRFVLCGKLKKSLSEFFFVLDYSQIPYETALYLFM